MFSTRKGTSNSAAFFSAWHDPSAVPLAPILLSSGAGAKTILPTRSDAAPTRVHWWDAQATRITGNSVVSSFYAQLPACGFFPPSDSYAPSGEDLPWSVSGTRFDAAYEDELKVQALMAQGRRGGFRLWRPLKRMARLTRAVADAIIMRRRNMRERKFTYPTSLGVGAVVDDDEVGVEDAEPNVTEAEAAEIEEVQRFMDDSCDADDEASFGDDEPSVDTEAADGVVDTSTVTEAEEEELTEVQKLMNDWICVLTKIESDPGLRVSIFGEHVY